MGQQRFAPGEPCLCGGGLGSIRMRFQVLEIYEDLAEVIRRTAVDDRVIDLRITFLVVIPLGVVGVCGG